eukprot:1219558-Pleurochrysis_carterae.AAC.1
MPCFFHSARPSDNQGTDNGCTVMLSFVPPAARLAARTALPRPAAVSRVPPEDFPLAGDAIVRACLARAQRSRIE